MPQKGRGGLPHLAPVLCPSAWQRDAEGAVNILRRLDTPAMREYRALRAALHGAKAVAFLTQQCMGLGLGWMSGTGEEAGQAQPRARAGRRITQQPLANDCLH